MAATEGPPRAHDRNGRRRAFSSWMKRLASLKNPSSESGTIRWSNKRHAGNKSKKSSNKHTPYPLSESNELNERESRSQSAPSLAYSGYDSHAHATSTKSTAPTVSTNGTNGEAGRSDEVYSKAGTLTTAGGGISTIGGGEGSTFSSPAPSVRSMTTTLTTVQSAAPSNQFYVAQNHNHGLTHVNSTQSTSAQQVQFSHQFPTTPVSAVPPHLAPHGHPTYSTATANNILTDNASILTLASSSKHRRRNSLDTNASIRALPPSSLFGGSRESLPLSILSGNAAEPSSASAFSVGGVPNRPSIAGLASTERASVYSSSGVAYLNGAGERTSLHTNRQGLDGASIRSGHYSHARNDSTAASLSGGVSGTPLTGPVVTQTVSNGRISRRSSGWGEITDGGSDEEKEAEQKTEEKTADEKSEHKVQWLAVGSEKSCAGVTPKQENFP
ncbi:hypothetical protein MPDQ_001922 [Monascus purpureus]|uniref:Uncharacterized protein n=1 Tax=Monascus purpureus TaxID=5098 RepID=A0A507QNF6_MONPU|nr:hypothetical protein MPDQ_001922 [Monascus purpureus]BDD61118.1 hypothetical protein MAP00_006188 [Monascus purpureus]